VEQVPDVPDLPNAGYQPAPPTGETAFPTETGDSTCPTLKLKRLRDPPQPHMNPLRSWQACETAEPV
jgi:hypothetical protein